MIGGLSMMGGGAHAQIGGIEATRRGIDIQQRGFEQAARGYGQDVERLGDEEIALTQQQMADYARLAGGYRDSLRNATQRYAARGQEFQSGIDPAMGGLQSAEQSVFGLSGVPNVPGPGQGAAGAWGDMRMPESEGRMQPSRELAAMLMAEDQLRPYDQQTRFGIADDLAGFNRDAAQTEQRGMLGRVLLDQRNQVVRGNYENNLAEAQQAGQWAQTVGAMVQGLGGGLMAQGLGSLSTRNAPAPQTPSRTPGLNPYAGAR